MSEGIAVEAREEPATGSCQHHWIIETPHGVTSRGTCKRCGVAKRFPNAAEDAIWESKGATLGRWSGRRPQAKPSEIFASDNPDD